MGAVVPSTGVTGWIEAQLTSADLKQLTAVAARKTASTWIMIAGFALAVFLPVLLLTPDHGLAVLVGIISSALICAVGLLVQYASSRKVGSSGPVRMRATRSGFEIQDRHSRGWVAWAGFERVLEDHNHIFLMLTRSMGYIVPKRCFPSKEAGDAFSRLARQNIDDGGPLEILEPAPETPVSGP